MIEETTSRDTETIEAILEQVADVYPRLAAIFRFRLDKVEQDEKDAVVSHYRAHRVRESIIAELREVRETKFR